MKTVKRIVSLLLITTLLFVCAAPPASAAGFDEYAPYFRNALFYDVTQNKVLYSKAPNELVQIASLTKLATAAVALSFVPETTVFTVGSELDLVHTGSSLCHISKGQQLTLKTLIYGLLIPSGNEAAYTIAVNVARLVSGSSLTDRQAVGYFCSLMNSFAVSAGAYSTNYDNPDGWDSDSNFSTANDLLKITQAALTYPLIRQAVAISMITVRLSDTVTTTWTNSNSLLLNTSRYYNRYVNGVKTGTTDAAGNCLIAKASFSGREYIAIVLNATSDSVRFNSVTSMFNVVSGGRPVGDLDGDFTVTSADARKALRIAVGLDRLSGDDLYYGDTDKDNAVTSADARQILRISVGLE